MKIEGKHHIEKRRKEEKMVRIKEGENTMEAPTLYSDHTVPVEDLQAATEQCEGYGRHYGDVTRIHL